MSTESRELPELRGLIRELRSGNRLTVFASDIADAIESALSAEGQQEPCSRCGRFCGDVDPPCADIPYSALAHSRAQDSGGEAAWCHIRPHVEEWHRVCEQAPHAEYVRMTGSLAEGLAAFVQDVMAAAQQPAKGDVPLCEKYGDGCNFPDCPCDVDGPLTQQPSKGECFADALDEDIQEARTPQPSDPANVELATLRQWVRDNMPPSYADTPLIECMAAMMECGIEAELEAMGNTPPTAQRHGEGELNPESTDYRCPDCGKLNYKPLGCQNCGYEPTAHGAGAAVEAVEVLAALPDEQTLDAVDDDDFSGRRPCPIVLTIAQVRSLRRALSTQPLLSDQPGGVSAGDASALHEIARSMRTRYAAPAGDGPSSDTISRNAFDVAFMLSNWADRIEAALHPEQAKDGAQT